MRLNLRFAFSSIAIPDDNLENLNIWHMIHRLTLLNMSKSMSLYSMLSQMKMFQMMRCLHIANSLLLVVVLYIHPQSCFYPTYRFIVKQWSLWFLQFLIEQKQLVLLMDKPVHVQSSLDPISTEHLISLELIFSTQVVERRIPCVPSHLRLPKIS